MRQFVYDISNPIVDIVNPIEGLEEFGDLYTPQQLSKFGLQMVKITGDLEKGNVEWQEKPRIEKNLGEF